MLCTPHWKAPKTAAFMLLETVIALGIIAVALVPMIGLLPIGMNTYRDAVDRTMGARISQQIAGEFALGASPATTQQARYFDLLGQETAGPDVAETIYSVNVVVVTPSSGLPGDQSADRVLSRVNIEVWYNPAHSPLSSVLGSDNRIIRAAGQQIRDYSFAVCY